MIGRNFLRAVPCQGWPAALKFSPVGHALAATSSFSPIQVWDTVTWQPRFISDLPAGAARTIEFSPDGTLLAAGMLSGSVWLFRTDDWHLKKRISHQYQEIWAVSFSPDSQYVAAGGGFGAELNVWDTRHGRHIVSIPQMSWSRSAPFSPDGKLLAVPLITEVSLYETRHWKLVRSLSLAQSEQGDQASNVSFSPDGRILAVSTFLSDVTLWSVEDGVRLGIIPVSKYHADNAMFSPDGLLLMTTGREEQNPLSPSQDTGAKTWKAVVKIWNTSRYDLVAAFETGDDKILAADFSADSALVATSGDTEETIRIWDIPKSDVS